MEQASGQLSASPADVGARVSLRRRLPVPAPGARFSDVLGELRDWSGGRLVVRRADGVDVAVDEPDVVAVKVVPKKAVRLDPEAIDDLTLEGVAADGWLPLEAAGLGGWRLRASEGWTGRANSVLPLGEPDRPFPPALEAVQAWYAERGLPAQFQLPLRARAALDGELADRGWVAGGGAQVQTARIATVLAALPDRVVGPAALPPVELAVDLDEDFLSLYRQREGQLPPAARRVLTGGKPIFAAVRDAGAVLAVGRAVTERGWVGLSAVEVAPEARRRGLAGHVTRALLTCGAERGGRSAYLQVAAGNEAAFALYARCGFAGHHVYHYRTEPA